MPTSVHLPPELARFVRECVASGRYRSTSDVLRAALRLLQDAEDRRRRFAAMMQAPEDPPPKPAATYTLEDVRADVEKALNEPGK
jgi:antitoxin ParD1/3/4